MRRIPTVVFWFLRCRLHVAAPIGHSTCFASYTPTRHYRARGLTYRGVNSTTANLRFSFISFCSTLLMCQFYEERDRRLATNSQVLEEGATFKWNVNVKNVENVFKKNFRNSEESSYGSANFLASATLFSQQAEVGIC